jgi:hypothetical protein
LVNPPRAAVSWILALEVQVTLLTVAGDSASGPGVATLPFAVVTLHCGNPQAKPAEAGV